MSTTFFAVGCPSAYGGDGVAHIYHIDSIIRDDYKEHMIRIDPNDDDSFEVGSQIEIMEFNHM